MKKILGVYQNKHMHWVGDGFPVYNLFSYDRLGQSLSPFLHRLLQIRIHFDQFVVRNLKFARDALFVRRRLRESRREQDHLRHRKDQQAQRRRVFDQRPAVVI